ncbi:hypothetical protein Bbelb_115800 [Branchiostoma belcheri]|nr:hypothetical protein Bbelb_115800 [Branchiostoma belcheri]
MALRHLNDRRFHFTTGVYSIVLTVEDGCGPNDGNFVITRRFLIYDDNSTVQADTSGHHPMWAESASNITGRVWQTNLQDALGNGPQVTISWPDHFCNELHKHNKFLNAIEEHPSPILPGYEEITGQPPATRSREAIPNVNTILLFQTDWAVDHQGGRSLSSPPGNWQNVTDLMVETCVDLLLERAGMNRNESWELPKSYLPLLRKEAGEITRYQNRKFRVRGQPRGVNREGSGVNQRGQGSTVDIEPNPGPNSEGTRDEALSISSAYLCGSCHEPVTWEDKGVMCEQCDTWDFVNEREESLESDSAESLWVKITIQGCKTLYVGACYRPSENDDITTNLLDQSLRKISSSDKNIILLGGDFNLPGWNWVDKTLKPRTRHVAKHRQFADSMHDNGLTQIVEGPTRGENTLDLILTNRPTQINRTQIIPGISDHLAVYTELEVKPMRKRQIPRKIPLYTKADWDGFRRFAQDLAHKVRVAEPTSNTNQLWLILKDGLTEGVKAYIPHRMTKTKDSYPWINPALKRKIRRRNKAYKNSKRTGRLSDEVKFVKLKHEVQRDLRRAYWKYIEDTITPETEEDNGTCRKKFWKLIKQQRTDHSGIASLKDKGRLITDPQQKAELLNAQFHSVFTRETHNIPTCRGRKTKPTTRISISREGVLNLLKKLNPAKAAGPDGLSPRIFRELSEELADPLARIFQKSLQERKVPIDWKHAKVTPIFKKARLFADDTMIYMTVSSLGDSQKLQSDLDALAEWGEAWMMDFHPDKCEVLTITRKRSPVVYDYSLHGHVLKHVSAVRYLGVHIPGDLRWDGHVDRGGGQGVAPLPIEELGFPVLLLTPYKLNKKATTPHSPPPHVQVQLQRQSRDVPREDGDTVRFWVRAFDVMSNFADDYVTIHVDSSPPVIEDIFLSRGGVNTSAVHHSQDLDKMTVVFTAYDDHSGLHNIHWELHDMADPTVVHGEGQVAVRRPSTIHPECPPPFCTCIPKDEECYFRNYEFSPDKNKMNISEGTQCHDYYIIITVTNNAMLQTRGRFQNYTCVDLPNDFLCDCGSPTWPYASQSMPPWQIALVTVLCLGVTIAVVVIWAMRYASKKDKYKIEPPRISDENIEFTNMYTERTSGLVELKQNPGVRPELPTEAPQAPQVPLKALKETGPNKGNR